MERKCGDWRRGGKIERFCKKVLRIPRFASNGIAELEVEGDRKQEVWLAVKD
jgi:hypothetical protein